MNAEIVYTKIVYQVITALAFGGLLLYQIKNKRKHNIRFDQTIFIYLIWLIASLLGVVYINSELVNFGRGVPNVWSVFIAVFLFYLYDHLNFLYCSELKFEYQNYMFLKTFYMNLILTFSPILILNYNLLDIFLLFL